MTERRDFSTTLEMTGEYVTACHSELAEESQRESGISRLRSK